MYIGNYLYLKTKYLFICKHLRWTKKFFCFFYWIWVHILPRSSSAKLQKWFEKDGQKQINCKDMKTTKELARWDLKTFQVRHSHSHDIMIINVIITKVFVVIVITHIYLNIFFFYRELGLLRQRRNAGNDRFSKKRPRSNCKKYPSCYVIIQPMFCKHDKFYL